MCCEKPSKNRNQLKQTKHKTHKPLETLESLCLTADSVPNQPAGTSCQKPEYPSKSCNSSNYSFPKLELDKGQGELRLLFFKLHERQIGISIKWFLLQEYLRKTRANPIRRTEMSPSYFEESRSL